MLGVDASFLNSLRKNIKSEGHDNAKTTEHTYIKCAIGVYTKR
jgi:hypothetical protein